MRFAAKVTTLILVLAAASPALARPDRARSRAEAAIKKLAAGQELTVRWRADRARPAVIRGLALPTRGKTVTARALDFVAAHPALFLPAGQLRVADTRAAAGLSVVRFQQVTAGGVPVDGGELTVAMDSAGKVSAVHCELITLDSQAPAARIDARGALARALGRLVGKDGPVAVPAELASLRPSLMVMPGAPPRPVYRVVLPLWVDMLGRIHLVDAVTGEVIGWRQGMKVDGHQHNQAVSR